jgi:hypothetical protein
MAGVEVQGQHHPQEPQVVLHLHLVVEEVLQTLEEPVLRHKVILVVLEHPLHTLVVEVEVDLQQQVVMVPRLMVVQGDLEHKHHQVLEIQSLTLILPISGILPVVAVEVLMEEHHLQD